MNRLLTGAVLAVILCVAQAQAAPVLSNAQQPARVVFMNREIAELRASFLSASPTDRAIDAERRIDRAAQRGGPGRVSRQALAEGIALKVDGMLVFVLIPGDVDSLAGESLATQSEKSAQVLALAMNEWREGRSTPRLLGGLLWSVVATLIFVGLLIGLSRVRRWLSDTLSPKAQSQAERIQLAGIKLFRGETLVLLASRGTGLLAGIIALVFTYLWVTFVFRRFPLTRAWGEQLRELLLGSVSSVFGQAIAAFPDLLVATVIFVLARFLVKSLNAFFNAVEVRQLEIGWLDRDTVPPTRRIAALVVWLFAVAMAYPYLPGSDTEAFKGLSVLVGLMISLGSSSVIGQGASGLVLMYTRAFRPGEYIRVGDSDGRLVELGLFATRLRGPTGVEITIPNSVVLGSVTRNRSRTANPGAHVLETGVTIGYDAPWRQVHAMLLEAARRTRGVLADPPPRVYQAQLSDFYVDYRLFCQFRLTDDRTAVEVQDELHANIQDQFNEHGIQIMSPHYEGDPNQAKIVPKDRWNASPASPSKSEAPS